MSGLFSIGPRLRIAITAATLSACGHDAGQCLALPCALPIALRITLTTAPAGGLLTNAVVQFTGPMTGTSPCSQSCIVPGYGGTYKLDISAPGFQNVQRTVTVDGTAPTECGCGSANTVHLDIALVAAP